MLKVGFIGLGLMGFPMAKHVLEANFNLYLWNRSKDKCKGLVESGAVLKNTPKDLANSVDIILLCVTDERAVKAILAGKNGILAAKKTEPLIIVDHSTINPKSAEIIAKKVKKAGHIYIDAPVTGSVPGAVAGSLVIFGGGDEAIIKKISPILSTYSKRITYMGESGKGQATKICNQVMLLNIILATFETINLARKLQIDIDKLFQSFRGNMIDCKAWRVFGKAAISRREKKLAYIKDVMQNLKYINLTAEQIDSPIFLSKTSAKLVKKMIDKGLGGEDVSELMQLYYD